MKQLVHLTNMLTINIITLFPNLFAESIKTLPLKKAIEKELLAINLINLRDFGLDNYGTVDDTPYGGGVGMILRVEPIYNAMLRIYKTDANFPAKTESNRKVVLLSPTGERYTQQKAAEYSNCKELTFICGRYEGVDNRVEQLLATETISIGDFVVSGGEIPTLAIMESATRLLPGILEKEQAAKIESFSSTDFKKEYPQYTRPEDFKGYRVPDVLLSGNHKEIEKWRLKNAIKD